MSLLVLSDAHLSGPDDPALHGLCARVSRAPTEAVALLGDLLHAGWTWRKPSLSDDVIHAVLGAVGPRPLYICPGNHDFGLRWPARRRGAPRSVAAAHALTVDGRRLLLVHGDLADRRPGYRLLRPLLRGAPFRALIGAAGPRRGQRWLDRLAGAPGADPDRVDGELVGLQRHWGQAQLQAGVADVIFQGHSHHFGAEAAPGGQLVWTGAWLGQQASVEVDAEGVHLCTGVAGRRLPAPPARSPTVGGAP